MIAAVVLAAGFARRMGRPKLLLEIGGKPIVRHAVEGILPHVDETIVVTGPGDARVVDALAGLLVRFAVNPRPEDGQGTSIAAGISALSADSDAALVALGDQPAVPQTVVPALLDALRRTGKSVIAPVYRGVQGTPVLFRRDVFAELAALSGDAGARSVVQRDPARVERVLFDLAMPVDVDTPEDYARLSVHRDDTGERHRGVQ